MKSLCYGLSAACLMMTIACSENPQPIYPKKVEPPPVSPPPFELGGRWYSDFGYMDLEQDGLEVEGTYSCCNGKIRGRWQGSQLEFTWEDEVYGSGWGYFYVRDRGRKLVGTWGEKDAFGSSGRWNAVRLEELAYDGIPKRFAVTAEHPVYGEIVGRATLYFDGDLIGGTWQGSASLEARGKPYRVELYRYLEGSAEGDEVVLTWNEPRTGDVGEIRLRRDGEVLRGDWDVYRSERDESGAIVFVPTDS
ncbi:MAG: hypothetical protein D6696_03920 [Acidobacteria bacterium]|nr:MAG: hypothetical protein D6696_03920 [Acidobacteriota bacterium]